MAGFADFFVKSMSETIAMLDTNACLQSIMSKNIVLFLLILLTLSLACTGLGIWFVIYHNIGACAFLFVGYSVAVYYLAKYFINGNEAVLFMIAFPIFFGVAGLVIALSIVDSYKEKAGELYVLGDVCDVRQYRSKPRRDSEKINFEAVIKTPTFGLCDDDTLTYDFFDSDYNLNATFPIHGKKVLMKYPVALPGHVSYEDLNPNYWQLRRFSPVIVTPDGDTLENKDAINYIEDFIRNNK